MEERREKLLLEALALRKIVLGNKHNLIGQIVDVLLEMYKRQGRGEAAGVLVLSVVDE